MARLAVVLAVCAGTLVASSSAHAFSLGFNGENLATDYSGIFSQAPNDAALAAGLGEAHAAGAQTWRMQVHWGMTARGATTAPVPATLAADPAWTGYRWDNVDRMVRAVTTAGMQPLLWPHNAPAWAEGANPPSNRKSIPLGSWKPNAGYFEQFARALATRYSGSYPDPANPGQALPRVSLWQGWNEPNLYIELNPQWEKVGKSTRAASVELYRQLQNHFYNGIKSVQPGATVLSAGTAPFGGLTSSDPRVPPARFYRQLFCVTKHGSSLTARKSCPKLKFDGWAHHTYPIGPPTRTSRNIDDVVVPDMPKLTKIMTAARKAKLVSRSAQKNVWITEMSWDSYPDPEALSLADQALYMQGAFYVLWKAGVKHVLWWNSRDDAKGADWNATLQSGIFLRGATPAQDVAKPSATAYRFPFTAYRVKGTAALWTKLPGSGPVTVQAESGAGVWTTVATLKARSDGTATGRVRVGPATNLRAVQGTDTSLTWKTF